MDNGSRHVSHSSTTYPMWRHDVGRRCRRRARESLGSSRVLRDTLLEGMTAGGGRRRRRGDQRTRISHGADHQDRATSPAWWDTNMQANMGPTGMGY